MLYIDVLLPLALPAELAYALPDGMQAEAGVRVAVPLGKTKIYAGIVLRTHCNTPPYPVREVLSVIDAAPVASGAQIALWHWAAHYYVCTLGEVMKAALPAALKMESQTQFVLCRPLPDTAPTTAKEDMVIAALRRREPLSIDELAAALPKRHLLGVLQDLMHKNLIAIKEMMQTACKPKTITLVALAPSVRSEEDVNAIFAAFKRSPQQEKLLLAYLAAAMPLDYAAPLQIERQQLLGNAGVTSAVLKTAVGKGIFVQTEQEENAPPHPDPAAAQPDLSEAQTLALNEINQHFENKNVVLLHGVTSSGKTEIYIHLIAQTLRQGRQALFLVPEIALTAQLIRRLSKVFGGAVGVYHSKFSDSQRAAAYYSLLRGQTQVLLGARSAALLPFANLGLVIVDEEHELTYKQTDPAPRYHARDLAIVAAVQSGARVLLGSATPSIETYYNTQTGKYGLVRLTERYGSAVLPQITMVNVSDLRQRSGGSLFSPLLLKEMEERMGRGEQIILFQNRRGFAPRIECRDCGWTPQCEHCSVSLVYHKNTHSLTCHYCGYALPLPQACRACGSIDLASKGFGTEKVEEELRLIFPDAPVERLDLDAARSRTALQRIIADFEAGKTSILAGTQMITKGLDFDNVGLVGVLDADGMLTQPDFRSAERSFQLICQVAGRAGRRHSQSRVLVQTRTPLHPVLLQVQANDYEAMYAQQIGDRQKFGYPPFVRLIRVTLKHRDLNLLHSAAAALEQALRTEFGRQMLGPETPLVNRVRGLHMLNFWLKIPAATPIAQAKTLLRERLLNLRAQERFRSVAAVIDVDAY